MRTLTLLISIISFSCLSSEPSDHMRLNDADLPKNDNVKKTESYNSYESDILSTCHSVLLLDTVYTTPNLFFSSNQLKFKEATPTDQPGKT